MKAILKNLLSSINLFTIAFTLTLAPVAFDNNAFAEENGMPCASGSEQAEGEVYRAGCDQNLAIAATQMDSTASDSGMIMGIIQQAITGMMAVVLVKSIMYKYIKSYRNDCPMDKSAKVTLLIAQLASLSYLIGDLTANMKFKKLAQEAADKAFGGVNIKMDDKNTKGNQKAAAKEHNEEQVKAFNTMIEILEGQIKAMETKVALTAVTEVGYIAAEVAELIGIAGTTATCTASYTTYASAKTSSTGAIQAIVGSATGEAATYAATVYGSANATACTTLAGLAQTKAGTEIAKETKKGVEATKETTKKNFKDTKVGAFFIKEWQGLKSLVTGPINAISSIFNKIPSTQEIEISETAAKSLANGAQVTSEKVSDTADLATIKVTTICPMSYAAAELAYNSDLAADQLPVICCGVYGDDANPMTGAKGANATSPGTDAAIVTDVKGPANLVGSIFKDKGFNPKDVLLNIIENSLYAQSVKLINQNDNASSNLLRLSNYFRNIDKGMTQVRDSMDQFNFSDMDMDNVPVSKLAKSLEIALSKISPITTANAGLVSGAISGMALKAIGSKISGPWKEVFNLGSKYLMLNAILGKIAKEWAFVKKKNRAITWGLMTAINTAVLVFDVKTLNKIKDHKKTLEDDKKRFVEAAGNGVTPWGEEDGLSDPSLGPGHDYSNVPLFGDGSADFTACVAPVAGGFIPDSCKNKRSNKPYQIPQMSFGNIAGVDYKGLNDALGFVSSSAYNAGSGAYMRNGGLAGSTFANASNHRNALNKIKKKLIARVDREDKKYAPKGKNGKPIVSPLASIQKGFVDTYATPIAIDGKDLKDLLEDNKTEKSSVAVTSPKKIIAPVKKTNPGSGFDLEFDDFEDEAKPENLAKVDPNEDLIIEHNDIVKKPDVSIFKVLSNRYIISYPKLLEEK